MDQKTARHWLINRLKQLDEEDRISVADRSPVTLDQESAGRLSRIDAMQVQAMAIAAARRRQAEKRRVDVALTRLGKSEWGWCIKCGDQIAAARLDYDPSMLTCIECASND